jgi:hypothetical protein
MPTTLQACYDMVLRLSAESVDAVLGVIKGVTVAKSGVQATGKFILVDKDGKHTRDEKLGKRKLPVFTDDATLTTLMDAAKAAGPRVKSREDHDDSIGARAGYADTFRRENDRVVADLHVFESYRNRALVLETATATPGEIGLSIDMTPTFEIVGEKALMRISELHAVDIVDEGAITPEGLLLSAGVDRPARMKTQPPETMDEETLKAINALTSKVNDCMTAIGKLTAPPPAADAEMKAIKEQNEKLAATVEASTKALKEVTASIAQMKREKALLGFRGSAEQRGTIVALPAEEIEKLNAEQKSYLTLVDECVAKEKCSRVDAHGRVQKTDEGKLAYRAHLDAKGVSGRQTMAA